MGEKQNQPFQLSFNSSLKVDFQGSRVASDGGPVKHAQHYCLLLAESHLTRRLFASMLWRIDGRRFRRDSRGCGTQEKDSAILQEWRVV